MPLRPQALRRSARLIMVAALVLPVGAGAAEREYGVAAGLGSALAPADPLGVSVALSAAAMPSGGGLRLVRARGEVLLFLADGAWAALPTISGDVGLRLGRFHLYLTGGFELFGGARRDGYTSFSTFGLLGGAGAAVQITPRLRLGLRGLATWLPSFSSAKLDAPEGASEPRYLFAAGMLSLELGAGPAIDDFDLDED